MRTSLWVSAMLGATLLCGSAGAEPRSAHFGRAHEARAFSRFDRHVRERPVREARRAEVKPIGGHHDRPSSGRPDSSDGRRFHGRAWALPATCRASDPVCRAVFKRATGR
jgi:hypothetical protein